MKTLLLAFLVSIPAWGQVAIGGNSVTIGGNGQVTVNGKSYSCPSGNINVNFNKVTCDGKVISGGGRDAGPCGNGQKLVPYKNPDGSAGGLVSATTKILSPATVFISSDTTICGSYKISGVVSITESQFNSTGVINGKGKKGVTIKKGTFNDEVDLAGDGLVVSGSTVNDHLSMCDSSQLVGGVINDGASLQDFAKIVGTVVNASVTLSKDAELTGEVVNDDLVLPKPKKKK